MIKCMAIGILLTTNFAYGAAASDDVVARGLTALIIAVANNNIAKVENLLSLKVNINETDVRGQTPLYHAAIRGHEQIVQILLAAKADPNFSSLFSPLAAAASKNYNTLLSLLISSKADINKMDTVGGPRTALHAAILAGNNCGAEILLSAKADTEVEDPVDKKKKALYYALLGPKTNIQLLDLLLESGVGLGKFHMMTKEQYDSFIKNGGNPEILEHFANYRKSLSKAVRLKIKEKLHGRFDERGIEDIVIDYCIDEEVLAKEQIAKAELRMHN